MSSNLNPNGRPLVPSPAKEVTSTIRHELYPAISPSKSLLNAANGLNVLITGGGTGVGRALAETFAQAGVKKLALTGRNEQRLNDAREAIEAKVGVGKVFIITIPADIRVREDVQRIFEAAGELDVLINNAAAMELPLPIHESDPEEWWDVQETIVKGTYLMTREFLRRNLGRTQLTILNVTSIGSARTYPRHSSYISAKTQLNRFTEFIHFEYRDQNVRTFALHPGGFVTDLARYAVPEQARAENLFYDSLELPGGFALWLVSQGETVDFLRGRYLSANWDVEELLSMKDEIIKNDLLWTRITGYEQGLPLVEAPY